MIDSPKSNSVALDKATSGKTVQRSHCGFTLVEMMIACMIICISVAGGLWAMNMLNRRAFTSRLETLALTLAQQKIDDVLAVPWQMGQPTPTLLQTLPPPGPATVPPTADFKVTVENPTNTPPLPSGLPLGNDDLNNATGLSSAFTKQDFQVGAVRTTTVTKINDRMVRILVSVTFNYRGLSYSVSLRTLRAIDSI